MKTYQDLLKIGESVTAKGEFCLDAVKEFQKSTDYASAVAGEAYYNKHNLTIERYQKYLQTVTGRTVQDMISANYKLKTTFFRRLCIQQIQYVLGNGLQLTKTKNKERLGKDFDFKLQTAAKRAMAQGRAFGFWNLDHLEVFGFADTPAEPGFCPLYDEQTSMLMGGIRYWFRKIGNETIFRATLYEPDGITEYRKGNNNAVEVLKEKAAYKTIVKETKGTGIEERIEENYPGLPIIQLYANDSHESELIGIRECIDCYDLVKSGLANDIDDLSGFYWIIENSGGMDDFDLARFIQRMKTVRAAAIDSDDGAKAEAHTQEIPVNARTVMLELLRKDIYEDFQALDVNTLSAAAKTAQEIRAAYQAQDNKCADFEYYIIDFVQQILALADVDDIPTFAWNRIANEADETKMVLSAANYLSEECIIRHLPFLTPEEIDEEIKTRQKEQLDRFGYGANGAQDEPVDDNEEEQYGGTENE